jgi:hypothetical protein
MYAYVKRMCQACPGCALANPNRGKSSELVYNFPIKASFPVMFFDAYSAGKHASYEGSECYLIGCCRMCGFACMEPITSALATTFSSAIMKVLLRYGFCHTIVLNKDSKFFGVCRKTIDLLQINCLIPSSANHNSMIDKRVNQYFNKGLKIMYNERDSVRVALEAILLLLYAWNSCPVPDIDISCSLIAVGREFAFPIDFSSGKHWELTSSPSTVISYSKKLATRLAACCLVAKLLVCKQCSDHRELINACCPDPHLYSVGDIVFARRAVRSDSTCGQVNKLQYTFTGPWRISAILKGASYEIVHCDNATQKEKKHASDLSPYPTKLILFQPVNGADTWYGQLYKPITAHPLKEAGIKGFFPIQLFQIPVNLAQTDQCVKFDWPSFSEFNDEIAPFPWLSNDKYWHYLEGDSVTTLPVLTTGPPPPPAAPAHSVPTVPEIYLLTAAIIKSTNRLFFVSHSIGANDACEWHLAQVAFTDSISVYPLCTLDSRFLFEFYICHPADWHYNAVNQCYWIQYHGWEDITHPTLSTKTHLVSPSDTSDDYA